MGITIRLAETDDAATLADIAGRTFADTFAADNTDDDMALHLARSYGVAQQSAELADPTILSWMVEVDRVPAAYAQLRRNTPPACVAGPSPIELWRFYVDRPWHGRGLAQQLMTAIADDARTRGHATLWLGVWERNTRAQAFYRKCGFTDVGEQRFVLGRDVQTDRVMSRPLSL